MINLEVTIWSLSFLLVIFILLAVTYPPVEELDDEEPMDSSEDFTDEQMNYGWNEESDHAKQSLEASIKTIEEKLSKKKGKNDNR